MGFGGLDLKDVTLFNTLTGEELGNVNAGLTFVYAPAYTGDVFPSFNYSQTLSGKIGFSDCGMYKLIGLDCTKDEVHKALRHRKKRIRKKYAKKIIDKNSNL